MLKATQIRIDSTPEQEDMLQVTDEQQTRYH